MNTNQMTVTVTWTSPNVEFEVTVPVDYTLEEIWEEAEKQFLAEFETAKEDWIEYPPSYLDSL